MGLFSGIAGGLIGGAIGAAIWAAVSHLANVEVGYIAWGIGLLVGLGFRYLGGNASGPVAGLSAALIAVVSILAGKWCALALALGGIGGEFEVTHEHCIAHEAQQIADDREAKGEKLDWPKIAEDDENAESRDHFPKAIWTEAEQKWIKLTAEEKQATLEQRKKEYQEFAGQLAGAMQWDFFWKSFGVFDLIFGALAISTAYKMASSGPSEETAPTADSLPGPQPS